MPNAFGTVEELKLSDGRGFVRIQRDDTPRPMGEIFIIWFGDQSHGPSALWTSQLTTAMVRRLRVRIFHGQTSGYIEDLSIFAPAP